MDSYFWFIVGLLTLWFSEFRAPWILTAVGLFWMVLVVGAIAGDDEVLLGFGSRQLGDSNPPDADTQFEIGSITKVFTGILLAGRIENGELPRLPENLFGFSGAFRSLFGGDPFRDYGEQAFREALATTNVEFEPGTRCLYSNFAVGLLGFALATHAQTDYAMLVRCGLVIT